MTLEFKRILVAALSGLFLLALLVVAWVEGGQQRVEPKPRPSVTGESKKCVTCHEQKTPGIVAQWADSKHAVLGVACYECHRAEESDADAFRHEGQWIATVVTPKDCSGCHADIAREFWNSHHSKAAQFVGSLDNILGEIVEGPLAAANGCLQCHGSTVAFARGPDGQARRDANGKPEFDPLTWPNTGIGRVNMDGSRGACSACHSRHAFQRSMARQPDVCGKCHMGPDHPQIEIYNESKHGIAFRTRQAEMNLGSESWVLGVDYDAAPTCATCHMSATRNLPVTHDVGQRISWTLRPVVSKKLENWEKKREQMTDVCSNCHSPDFVRGFYRQYDATVDMWNTKFALPAQSIMTALREEKKITPDPFDDDIEWTFYRLWHHEGRRARMGVSMQGPDYTQWHGFFEVAENFYFRFLPAAEELGRGNLKIQAAIKKVLTDEPHRWRQGMSPEIRQKIDQFYKERYGS